MYGIRVGVWCRAICKSGMHKCSTQKFVKHLGISLLMWLEVLHCFPLQVGLTANVAKLKCLYKAHNKTVAVYRANERCTNILHKSIYTE